MNFKLNGNETRSPSQTFVLFAVALFLACAAPQAGAETLDAQAVKGLVSSHTWKLRMTSGVVGFWTFKPDGSLCPRQNTMDSKCMDKGTWKLDGNRFCYQFTYLGGTEGWKSNCLRIVDHGQGRYEGLEDNGMTFFEFSVAK